MNERWALVRQLFSAALNLRGPSRNAVLDGNSSESPSVVAEVRRLLLADEAAAVSFLAPLTSGQALPESGPSFQLMIAGTCLGPYEILESIGAGGMGEVYRARDTRLGRTVAIKVCAERFSDRFRREARAIAALNHPNICTLHDIAESAGRDFLVMEYIEGQTLREVIGGRPIPVAAVIEYATQMADALAEAHAKGIVHRDLKPANVMITQRGQVKILDFGLAKRPDHRDGAPGTANTGLSLEVTKAGEIVGTVHYMSPEQSLGLPVDTRSDLFSAGVVMYEMATGRAPFGGSSATAVADEILHKTPATPTRFNPEIPAKFVEILARMLEKDPEIRYQSATDLRADLERLGRDRQPQSVLAQARHGNRWRPRVLAAGALMALSMLVWFVFRDWMSEQPSGTLPFTTTPGAEISPMFSPDGKTVAFAGNDKSGSGFRIYVKRTDSGAALRLTNGSGNDYSPVWSPNGSQLAYARTSGPDSGVFTVPALGGQERRLTDSAPCDVSWRRGLAWSPDGSSLLVSEKAAKGGLCNLHLLSIKTGQKKQLTHRERYSDFAPSFSPDGSKVVFVRELEYWVHDLFVMPVSGGEPRRLTFDRTGCNSPVWTPDGRAILFTSLRAVDSGLWKVSSAGGMPQRVAGVSGDVNEVALSPQGNQLVYTRAEIDYNIYKVDVRPGQSPIPTSVIASTRRDTSARFSPDGKRIAFASDRSGTLEIWVADSDGANAIQLTSYWRGNTGSPAWSPDGKWIAFDGRAAESADIYIIGADGRNARRLTTEPSREIIPSWSRDGKRVYFGSDRSGAQQIWMQAADGSSPAVQVTRMGGSQAEESLDGRFLYYRKPASSAFWRVPVDGGEEVEILDDPAMLHRMWAPAMKGFYVAKKAEAGRQVLGFYELSSRRFHPILALERPLTDAWGFLSLSPEGRFLLYSTIDRQEMDLVLIDNFR